MKIKHPLPTEINIYEKLSVRWALDIPMIFKFGTRPQEIKIP